MFTGIIRAFGKVSAVTQAACGGRLTVDIDQLAERPAIGGSICVDGVCLTVVELRWPRAAFDVVAETLSKTTLGELRRNSQVNLEPALKVSERIEGHFVLGHIDTTCKIVNTRSEGIGARLAFEPADRHYLRYIVPKGSVALDGISLTVAERTADGFEVVVTGSTWRPIFS